MKPKRIEPGPGQESVWDYPRPPRLERVAERLRIEHRGVTIAETTRGHRVLETSHPPVYYIPPGDCRMDLLVRSERRSFCEWKGGAGYVNLEIDSDRVPDVAWYYPSPVPAFDAIRDALAFYPSKIDACYVGDERVQAQPGDFYGGWITPKIVGPFKGAAGTWGW